MVIGRSLLLVLAGIGVGIPRALGLTRYLKTLLFGVEPADAATFAVTCLVLLAAGIGAAWIPARRAAHVDPVVALRSE